MNIGERKLLGVVLFILLAVASKVLTFRHVSSTMVPSCLILISGVQGIVMFSSRPARYEKHYTRHAVMLLDSPLLVFK